MPGSTIGETSNAKDSTDTTIHLNDASESDPEQNMCNGVTTPQQSNSDIKHYDNSIFNTISKIVNRTAKVRFITGLLEYAIVERSILIKF